MKATAGSPSYGKALKRCYGNENRKLLMRFSGGLERGKLKAEMKQAEGGGIRKAETVKA
jgi:hypothetical protein